MPPAGGRPATRPAPFDRQRWVAALAVVALLGGSNDVDNRVTVCVDIDNPQVVDGDA